MLRTQPCYPIRRQTCKEFLELWMMPFIFVISGASLYYALGKGSMLEQRRNIYQR